MTETDEIDIKIKIANQQVTLHQPLNNQEFIRDVEGRIEDLWSTWRARFPNLSESKLLAMMVYQYASFYFQMRHKYDAAGESVRATSRVLEEALGKE